MRAALFAKPSYEDFPKLAYFSGRLHSKDYNISVSFLGSPY